MVQKVLIGRLHLNANHEKTSGLTENRHNQSKTAFKITDYWEVWDVQVRKLKETMFRN